MAHYEASTFFSLDAIKRANRDSGGHWFSPDTLRFFRSRMGQSIFGGRFFVSSEQAPGEARRYSIRYAVRTGEIGTVGEFQAYASARHARAAAWALIRSVVPGTISADFYHVPGAEPHWLAFPHDGTPPTRLADVPAAPFNKLRRSLETLMLAAIEESERES